MPHILRIHAHGRFSYGQSEWHKNDEWLTEGPAAVCVILGLSLFRHICVSLPEKAPASALIYAIEPYLLSSAEDMFISSHKDQANTHIYYCSQSSVIEDLRCISQHCRVEAVYCEHELLRASMSSPVYYWCAYTPRAGVFLCPSGQLVTWPYALLDDLIAQEGGALVVCLGHVDVQLPMEVSRQAWPIYRADIYRQVRNYRRILKVSRLIRWPEVRDVWARYVLMVSVIACAVLGVDNVVRGVHVYQSKAAWQQGQEQKTQHDFFSLATVFYYALSRGSLSPPERIMYAQHQLTVYWPVQLSNASVRLLCLLISDEGYTCHATKTLRGSKVLLSDQWEAS